MDTRQKTVVHEEHVSGPGFDPELYVSKRVWATGDDGTTVPISLVYRRDLLRIGNQQQQQQQFSQATNGGGDGSSFMGDPSDQTGLGISQTGVSAMGGTVGGGNPLLLHGYGAYGYCVDPIFTASRLSLLDRGFIYAVAHVRGGSDMGNGWYEEGKLAKKPNTFKDFISCAEFLIKEGYTSREKLAIYGRSAGGLLIGAVVNARPDLFKAVLTEVPFVDVINTMFDSSIPWTAFEFEVLLIN
jgi:oligopeptidase B